MFIVLPVLITLHVIVCLLIVFVVLMQRPRSEGLGAAFGGGMTDNLFGSQTTHVLAKLTSWLAVAFFGMTLLLSIITAKGAAGKTAIQESLLNAPIPQASAAPSAAPAPAAAPETAPTAAPAASPSH
ncbi:MAG: preprotein translocase subunit SecG [Terrimicrobiaceae bacterium]